MMHALGDFVHVLVPLRGEPCGRIERGEFTEIKCSGFWYITVGGRLVNAAPPASLARMKTATELLILSALSSWRCGID